MARTATTRCGVAVVRMRFAAGQFVRDIDEQKDHGDK
jgi:hypothetical protein